MLKIVWTDDYLIGDATIDAQHKRLFEFAEELLSAAEKKSLTEAAMKLYRHVREHFRHEEDLMLGINYPEYRQHVEMHNQMIGRLNALSADIGAGRWSGDSLQSFIREWVVGHILEQDTRLAAFVARQGVQ